MIYIILGFVAITLVIITKWQRTGEEKTAANNQMELIRKMLSLIWLVFLAGVINKMLSDGASFLTMFRSSFWPVMILILLVALKSVQIIFRSFPSEKRSPR
jgi:hypothetical protein